METARGGDVYRVVLPADMGADRLDRVLAAHLAQLLPAAPSRTRLKALIEAGQVALEGGSAQREPAAPALAGGTYLVTLPPPVDATPRPQAIPLAILFEDAHLIVIDKPAGLVTHPAPGNEDGTLVNALLAHCGDSLTGIGGERRPGIVHRLDKDTSGVMVAAKDEATLAALSADFAARRLDRSYLALAWGLVEPADGRWTGAIGRDPRDRKRMAVVAHGGRHATTRYRRLGVAHAAVSLLRCTLETGRTHQIRVHAAAAGHPLVGDPVYLRRSPALSRHLPAPLAGRFGAFPRQALHAERLGFRHPVTGAALLFTAPPPDDFRTLVEAAGLSVDADRSAPPVENA